MIVDPAELRNMDTTVWQIRPSLPGDRRGSIIVSSRGVAAPLSAEPIRVKASRILRVTDPHFALGKHRQQHVWRLESEPADGRRTLAEAIQQAVPGPVGLIVGTGDLTFLASSEEFFEARVALVRLLGIYDLDPSCLGA